MFQPTRLSDLILSNDDRSGILFRFKNEFAGRLDESQLAHGNPSSFDNQLDEEDDEEEDKKVTRARKPAKKKPSPLAGLVDDDDLEDIDLDNTAAAAAHNDPYKIPPRSQIDSQVDKDMFACIVRILEALHAQAKKFEENIILEGMNQSTDVEEFYRQQSLLQKYLPAIFGFNTDLLNGQIILKNSLLTQPLNVLMGVLDNEFTYLLNEKLSSYDMQSGVLSTHPLRVEMLKFLAKELQGLLGVYETATSQAANQLLDIAMLNHLHGSLMTTLAKIYIRLDAVDFNEKQKNALFNIHQLYAAYMSMRGDITNLITAMFEGGEAFFSGGNFDHVRESTESLYVRVNTWFSTFNQLNHPNDHSAKDLPPFVEYYDADGFKRHDEVAELVFGDQQRHADSNIMQGSFNGIRRYSESGVLEQTPSTASNVYGLFGMTRIAVNLLLFERHYFNHQIKQGDTLIDDFNQEMLKFFTAYTTYKTKSSSYDDAIKRKASQALINQFNHVTKLREDISTKFKDMGRVVQKCKEIIRLIDRNGLSQLDNERGHAGLFKNRLFEDVINAVDSLKKAYQEKTLPLFTTIEADYNELAASLSLSANQASRDRQDYVVDDDNLFLFSDQMRKQLTLYSLIFDLPTNPIDNFRLTRIGQNAGDLSPIDVDSNLITTKLAEVLNKIDERAIEKLDAKVKTLLASKDELNYTIADVVLLYKQRLERLSAMLKALTLENQTSKLEEYFSSDFANTYKPNHLVHDHGWLLSMILENVKATLADLSAVLLRGHYHPDKEPDEQVAVKARLATVFGKGEPGDIQYYAKEIHEIQSLLGLAREQLDGQNRHRFAAITHIIDPDTHGVIEMPVGFNSIALMQARHEHIIDDMQALLDRQRSPLMASAADAHAALLGATDENLFPNMSSMTTTLTTTTSIVAASSSSSSSSSSSALASLQLANGVAASSLATPSTDVVSPATATRAALVAMLKSNRLGGAFGGTSRNSLAFGTTFHLNANSAITGTTTGTTTNANVTNATVNGSASNSSRPQRRGTYAGLQFTPTHGGGNSSSSSTTSTTRRATPDDLERLAREAGSGQGPGRP